MATNTRQLAAIMFTDIVGYTALMENDEAKALEILEKNRSIQKPNIDKFGGKLHKEMGDGILASFPTVSDAVNCAINIQKASIQESDLSIRIGIDEGEVVFQDEDVFGDGVNIASRLEALAKPHGIYITHSVYKNIINKEGFEVSFVKEIILKNVSRPVRIYEVKVEGIESSESETTFDSLNVVEERRKTVPNIYQKISLYIGLSILIIFFLIYYIFFIGTDKRETQNSDSIIKSPTIAVLAFEDISQKGDQEYLGDGIAGEIIIALNHFKGIRVAGRTSSFSYKGKDTDLMKIGLDLNVASILEGSVQKSGTHLRVNAQLVNAESGLGIWTEQFNMEMKDIFLIQDEITKVIVDRLRSTLTVRSTLTDDSEFQESRYTSDPESYDDFLKGMYFQNGDELRFPSAIPYFENAIILDTSFAMAYAQLGYTYARMGWSGHMPQNEAFKKVFELARNALDVDPELAMGYTVLGLGYFYSSYDWDSTRINLELGIFKDSANALAYKELAYYYLYTGNSNKAIELAEKHVALDSANPYFLQDLARIYMHAEEYNQAIEVCQKTINLYPGYIDAYHNLGEIYLRQGDLVHSNDYYGKADSLSYPVKRNYDRLMRLSKAGQQQKTLQLLNVESQVLSYYQKAVIYANLGLTDLVIANLDSAFIVREWELTRFATDYYFHPYRSDQRFIEILKKLKIPMNVNGS